MNLVVLSHDDVEQLLPMDECIDVMTEALSALARDEVHQPLRTATRAPGAAGLLGLMPAYRGGSNPAYGLKEVCVFPGNSARGLDSHQGAVLLHSAETGELLAVMNASAITAIRTAAVSAVATRLLAREDAQVLGLVGAGVQARSHLEAMAAARDLTQVKVCSRRPEPARRFAEKAQERFSFSIEPVDSVEEAARDADIIVTATSSSDPVLERAWVAPGTHINAVGSSIRSARELDTATMAAASLFVDRRESTLNEAGEYLFAAEDGAIDANHIRAEIGDLLIGKHPGRTSRDEVTLFKSLGLAIQDLASAQHLYKRAQETGKGSRVPF